MTPEAVRRKPEEKTQDGGGQTVSGVRPQASGEFCDYCGAESLIWRKCKLICENCANIVKSCADL